MAIAHDAQSVAVGTTDFNISHGGGTPRAVVVTIEQDIGLTNELVSAPTYGGVTMSAVTGSPISFDGTEDGTVYMYFLGASIPTGTQNVVIDVDATASTKRVQVNTWTAAVNCEVIDTSTVSETATGNDSAITIQGGARNCKYLVAVWSGINEIANITQSAGWTDFDEHDYANSVGALYVLDAVSTGDQTLTLTMTANPGMAMLGMAFSEVEGGEDNVEDFLLLGCE